MHARARWLIWLAVSASSPETLAAQGVTGGAVQGTVLAPDGAPVADATILVTNTATGERWQTFTRTNGRFFLEHLSIGGPYSLHLRAIGFAPAERAGIFLSLGQRATSDFQLDPAAFQLEHLTVRAEADPRLNAGRTGPALTIPGPTIVRIPVDSRDFTGLALLSPQVTRSANGNLSFAGQHDRLNTVLIDGGTDNNVKGFKDGVFGIPGDESSFGLLTLVPEAVQELQVIAAPFDVRQGNFAGGLLNAVSRSGSNQWEGSFFSYIDSPKLAGRNPDGTRQDPYTRQEYGLTLGGPILRDRLAFFLSAGGRRQLFPLTTASPGRDTTRGADSAGLGIRYSSATRFQEILRNTYGVEPGTFESDPHRLPTRTVFAKVTAQLGINSRLEISQSHQYAGARYTGQRVPGYLGLSSQGSYDPYFVDATRLDWTTALGSRWTNQLLLAHRQKRHRCTPASAFPAVDVEVDAGVISAGEQRGCREGDNFESIWEVTNNLEFAAGSHHLTLGTHDEMIRVYDAGGLDHGTWYFQSLDSLEQSQPLAFERTVPGPLPPTGGYPDVRVNQVGFYLQDQWIPNPRLTITAGLRFDVPFLRTAPSENPELLAAFGISTAHTPSGNVLWSPRLGVNYDLSGRAESFLRGGIGLFAGRPAYVWLENAYGEAGVGQLLLSCDEGNAPAFTLDPAAQPSQCANIELPKPLITVFDPMFRYPRNLKIALGADALLGWGVVGTVDVLYTRGLNQFAERDLNLQPPSGVSAGEGGRALYGTVAPASGHSSPNRRSEAFESVVQITNGSGDRAYSLAFQLQKRFAGGTGLTVAYTNTHALDRTSSPSITARGNLGNSPLDGTWESPNLRTSLWSRPHKITLVATADLPFDVRLGLSYIGVSGTPLTYIVSGDANADGLDNIDLARHNDPIYVPRDASDITLIDPAEYDSKLSPFIDSEQCLRTQRGQLLQRNSCRNPWVNRLDGRLSKVVPTWSGQSLEITADLFNLLNFIDGDWGRVLQTMGEGGGVANGNRVSLLELVGYDLDRGRGIYRVLAPRQRELDMDATRWRLQLSARYLF